MTLSCENNSLMFKTEYPKPRFVKIIILGLKMTSLSRCGRAVSLLKLIYNMYPQDPCTAKVKFDATNHIFTRIWLEIRLSVEDV